MVTHLSLTLFDTLPRHNLEIAEQQPLYIAHPKADTGAKRKIY
jgi:hypothetical protein